MKSWRHAYEVSNQPLANEKALVSIDYEVAMKVHYLGPLVIGIDHPALGELDCGGYSPNCFAVEVGPDAGVHGAVIEGDVLVVDESHSLGHDDWVVVEMDDALHLYKTFRVGSRYRLLPPNGGNGLMATARMVRGVVVHQARCQLDEMA